MITEFGAFEQNIIDNIIIMGIKRQQSNFIRKQTNDI